MTAAWWNDSWDELVGRAGPSAGRLGRVGSPVQDSTVDDVGTADDALALWPRLTHDQRRRIQRAAVDFHLGRLPGPLLACMVAETPDDELASPLEEERSKLEQLVGQPWDVEALMNVAGDPLRAAGPLSGTVIGTRVEAAFAGAVGRELRHRVLDTAAMSAHLTYAEASRVLTSDPRLVLARPDAPFSEVVEGYLDPDEPDGLSDDAVHDWRVAKHPDCPAALVAQHVRRLSYRTAMEALDTPVSDAYVEALLRHPQQIYRRLVTRRSPRQVVSVLQTRMPVATWRHLAGDCPPWDPAYLEAFTAHPAVRVRSAYVRAHPDHPAVGERALADSSRYVRAALLRYTSTASHVAALAHDSSPAIRRDAAALLVTAMTRGAGRT